MATAKPDHGTLALIVADNGTGIDPEALPKLCRPFVLADASTSRRHGGSGLGLPISSVLGCGSSVRVTLPETRVMAVAGVVQPTAALARMSAAT